MRSLRKHKSLFGPLIAACLAVTLLALPVNVLAADTTGAKNVILMIGDGMGWAQVAVARCFAHGPGGELNMDKLEHSGYVSTFSLHSLATDSAAAATAMATGHKTVNGVIGQSASGEEYKTILEMAKDVGKSTGLVTTTEVTDATVAAFAAHDDSRRHAKAIAEDYLHDSQPDVVMGGGLRVWTTLPLKEAKDAGYKVVFTNEELQATDTLDTGKLLGLFDTGRMSYAMNRRVDEPSLIEMSLKSLELLSRDADGFFLIIEGGRIDHAGHANDSRAVLYDAVAFDETVGAVVEWLDTNGLADETLLIVTADHETGGLAVTGPRDFLPKRGNKAETKWAHDYHTAEDVPIWAQGPGAEAVNGRMDNTDIFRLMRDAFGIDQDVETP